MTIREQLYRFDDLDIHASIQMQKTIENRKIDMTKKDIEAKSDKIVKGILEELDQMYDDLDRHMAAIIRKQEMEKDPNTRLIS